MFLAGIIQFTMFFFGKINVLMLLNVADDFEGFPENN